MELTLTPENPPIIIPAGGGQFNFDVEAVNIGTEPTIFDFWLDVTLPNGTPFGPIMVKNNIPVNAGVSISRTMSQSIPARAPGGQYNYNGYVGDHETLNIWDSDSFTFVKDSVIVDGNTEWTITGWGSTAALEKEIPTEFILYPLYPNPFNNQTTISFHLSAPGKVEMAIFDVLGREVRVQQAAPLQEWYSAGYHSVVWNAEGYSSGIYFCKLETGGKVQVRKMILMK